MIITQIGLGVTAALQSISLATCLSHPSISVPGHSLLRKGAVKYFGICESVSKANAESGKAIRGLPCDMFSYARPYHDADISAIFYKMHY